MARNPYDRRNPDRAGIPDGRMMANIGSGPGTERDRRFGLTIEDLHAIAWNARHRGMSEAHMEHAEALAVARQSAWQEGYGAAMVDGRDAVLEQIDRLYGEHVRAEIEKAGKLLAVAETEPRKVSKQQLVLALDNARDTLRDLVDAHHRGFTQPVRVDARFG